MTPLADMAEQLKLARQQAGLSQAELARRADVSRITLVRMETLAGGDMSVSVLLKLLEAAGYDVKVVGVGDQRTLEDIIATRRTLRFLYRARKRFLHTCVRHSEVRVYDYVDANVPVLARIAAKRQAGYKALGYTIE